MATTSPNIMCDSEISEYLNGVKFKKKGDKGEAKSFCKFDSEGKLREKLFSDKVFIHDFKTAEAEIERAVEERCREHLAKTKSTKQEWIHCDRHSKCYKTLHRYAEKELKSTAFILKLLAKSMIDITKTQSQVDNGDDGKEVTVIYDGTSDFSEITGKWMDKKGGLLAKKRIVGDIDHFTIETTGETPRLVMALGPSSAGKTFSGTTVMKMIKEAKPDFPTKFLSIDGGIYREESKVYQTIIKTLKKYRTIIGFVDLVSPNWLAEKYHGTIFSSGTAKKEIATWLKSKGIKLSLYIPETLGTPARLENPMKKIKKYIDITGDKEWIGLLIWQHLNDIYSDEEYVGNNLIGKVLSGEQRQWSVHCDFPDLYSCYGTTRSGMKRQESEGKKYSPSAWVYSMENGEKMLKEAKGLRIDLHNSGHPEKKSTIKEYPLDDGSYVLNKDIAGKFNMFYKGVGKLPVVEESGPETEVPLVDEPQIPMVKRSPEAGGRRRTRGKKRTKSRRKSKRRKRRKSRRRKRRRKNLKKRTKRRR